MRLERALILILAILLTAGIASADYNLVEDTSGATFTPLANDITGQDPVLGALANNGGPTQTHAFLAGSPAIDAGNPAGCTDHLGNPLAADQRGMPRDGRCDMGAYEFGFSADVESVSEPTRRPVPDADVDSPV